MSDPTSPRLFPDWKSFLAAQGVDPSIYWDKDGNFLIKQIRHVRNGNEFDIYVTTNDGKEDLL